MSDFCLIAGAVLAFLCLVAVIVGLVAVGQWPIAVPFAALALILLGLLTDAPRA